MLSKDLSIPRLFDDLLAAHGLSDDGLIILQVSGPDYLESLVRQNANRRHIFIDEAKEVEAESCLRVHREESTGHYCLWIAVPTNPRTFYMNTEKWRRATGEGAVLLGKVFRNQPNVAAYSGGFNHHSNAAAVATSIPLPLGQGGGGSIIHSNAKYWSEGREESVGVQKGITYLLPRRKIFSSVCYMVKECSLAAGRHQQSSGDHSPVRVLSVSRRRSGRGRPARTGDRVVGPAGPLRLRRARLQRSEGKRRRSGGLSWGDSLRRELLPADA